MIELTRILQTEVPKFFLTKLISLKLQEVGIDDARGLVPALAEHVMSGTEDSFSRNDGTPSEEPERNLKLVFSEDDAKQLEESISRFLSDQLPDVLKSTIATSSKNLVRSLKRRWPEVDSYEQAGYLDFKERLEQRWGKGLGLLRMLLATSREIGDGAAKRLRRSRVQEAIVLRSVLLRLHCRACQVTAEIICLLESGYADGAMARWRTLHEICMVATLIADKGTSVAQRYIEHEIVESKHGLEDYDRCGPHMAMPSISDRDRKRTLREYARVIEAYGKDFDSPYGWAAECLGKKRPNFADIEAAARHAAMRSYYRFASHNVHAGTKGVFVRLSAMNDNAVVISGASNAGLQEPGENAAFSLTQITGLLVNFKRTNVQTLLEMNALVLIRDEAVGEFAGADRKLRREEARLSKRRRTHSSGK